MSSVSHTMIANRDMGPRPKAPLGPSHAMIADRDMRSRPKAPFRPSHTMMADGDIRLLHICTTTHIQAGTSPACTFVNGPLYGTKNRHPFVEQKKKQDRPPPRAAPLLKAPQCRSKILLLMSAKAAVSTTAAAPNETTIVANADIPTAHRHKRTHKRHKQTTARSQAQYKHGTSTRRAHKQPAAKAASHRSSQPRDGRDGAHEHISTSTRWHRHEHKMAQA